MRYLLTAILLVPPILNAHHSGSMFDFGEQTTITGEITRVRWTNPHVHFEIASIQDDGTTKVWTIEGEPPALMSKFGWDADSVIPGDRVTFTVNPPKNPSSSLAKAQSVVGNEGSTLWVSGATPYINLMNETPEAVEATSISGTWMSQLDPEAFQTLFHREPSPSLTEKANDSLRSFNDLLEPGKECAPTPPPYYMIVPITTVIEIDDQIIRIRSEGDQGGTVRQIYMDIDSHEGAQPSNMGHSIGRWDDDTLIVDTTHFAVHPYGHARGLPSSPQKHLVETFKLNDDRASIEYTFLVEDSEYLRIPATASISLLHRPDLEFVDVPCDLESAKEYLDEL